MFRTAAAVLFLDQLTKWIVLTYMEPHQSIPILREILHLTFVRNEGAAFGIFARQTWLFIIVTVIVIAALVYYGRRGALAQGWWGLALGLQLGGAIGNLIDRLRFGRVTDFIDLRVWPVFNVADMAIVTGVGLLLFLAWGRDQRPAAAGDGTAGEAGGAAGAGGSAGGHQG